MSIQISHVSKNYGPKRALNDVTVSFEDGVTGLLGPNGAGKSTLMRMIATIEIPVQGSITYNGQDIVKRPRDLRKALGYLPQDFGVYPNMNPVEFLEYMAAMSGISTRSAKTRINELLEVLHLADARKRPLGGFSGGMKQRVGIAQALLCDPKVLIVDEPTVGLDPEERIQFRNLLSSLAANRVIILSTHIVTDVESIAPKIAVLSGGKLLSCTTPEALIGLVEDKVWNCVVSASKLQALQKQYVVSSIMQRSDGLHTRVLARESPCLGAERTPPSLEDAYLYTTTERGDEQCA